MRGSTSDALASCVISQVYSFTTKTSVDEALARRAAHCLKAARRGSNSTWLVSTTAASSCSRVSCMALDRTACSSEAASYVNAFWMPIATFFVKASANTISSCEKFRAVVLLMSCSTPSIAPFAARIGTARMFFVL